MDPNTIQDNMDHNTILLAFMRIYQIAEDEAQYVTRQFPENTLHAIIRMNGGGISGERVPEILDGYHFRQRLARHLALKRSPEWEIVFFEEVKHPWREEWTADWRSYLVYSQCARRGQKPLRGLDRFIVYPGDQIESIKLDEWLPPQV